MCANFSRKSNMLFLHLSTIVLIGIFGACGADNWTTVVQTASGPVRGSIRTTVNSVKYAAFTGIPFAKPPVGNLRFKPPVDPDPWTKVYNATTDAPDCIQLPFVTMTIEGDEDCLYLNVATTMWNFTEAPTELKAVIVWIYGGAFFSGTSSLKFFRPDYLLEKDIVYVSLNYRDGPFGYLSLNYPNASGNAGLKDLVQGLKWIQKNIAKFGGNPKNVTIMGGSSGSAAIGYLVLSNLAAGLFHGSISMSGVPLNTWAFQSTAKCLHYAHRLTDELGISWTDPNSILEALYDVPAWNIINATTQMAQVFQPFIPTLENESIANEPFLTECTVTKYLTGRFNQIPQIIGYEDQETVSLVTMPAFVKDITNECISAAEIYHMEVPDSIMSAKERLNRNQSLYDDVSYKELRQFINQTSNLMFIAGIDQTQRFLAANNKNNPVYYYHISFYAKGPHMIALNDSLPGAGHADDGSFIFYFPQMNYSTNPTSPVRRTINRIVTMWTNFAKYGNPTPDWVDGGYPLNITWPDSGISGIILDIGNELSVSQRIVTTDMDVVENSSWRYLSEANECDNNSRITFTVPLKTLP